MSGEKTEQPTQRRREEARRKGQGVGRSHELSMGMTLAAGLLVMSSVFPATAMRVADTMRAAVQGMSSRSISETTALDALGRGLGLAFVLLIPLALAVLIAGVAGNLIGGGLVLSLHALKWDFARMNPIRGLRSMFNRQAWQRLAIAAAKLLILAFVSWQVLGTRVANLILMTNTSAGEIASALLDGMFQLGLTLLVLLAAVALVDFVLQRRQAQQSVKMTKEEVRQEYKEQEGDPLIKGARRRRARQMAFARMMDAVPTADVIVTNPTTYAVALKYDSLTMRAPHIVAKGQRLMAERIKELARAHGVPIVEDKPLARALFPRPLGSEVPPHLYRAVAQLLVIVQQARFGLGARRVVRSPA